MVNRSRSYGRVRKALLDVGLRDAGVELIVVGVHRKRIGAATLLPDHLTAARSPLVDVMLDPDRPGTTDECVPPVQAQRP